MRSRLVPLAAVAVAMSSFVAVGSVVTSGATTSSVSARVTPTNMVLKMAHPYTPTAVNGGTDDYHCALINPNLKQNSYIVSSYFQPGATNAKEVHHAILFLVPPNLAATAIAADNGGKGWTCFGEAVFSNSTVQIPGVKSSNQMPTWLSGWAPGHGKDTAPAGTGVYFPKGSLVVLQIHYNMLVGKGPVQSTLTLGTVPATTALKPLSLDLFPAPPDVPCPTSWNPSTTPLCQRSNALAFLKARFGQDAVNFVNLLEIGCGRNPNNPPTSNTTKCTWTYRHAARILGIGAHMHLTGASFKVVLNPGTSRQKLLLYVKSFNFDYQRSYHLATPVAVKSGDKVQVSCTYNPKIHDVNPELKNAPRRFIVWGDGSSDEMCLAMVSTTT